MTADTVAAGARARRDSPGEDAPCDEAVGVGVSAAGEINGVAGWASVPAASDVFASVLPPVPSATPGGADRISDPVAVDPVLGADAVGVDANAAGSAGADGGVDADGVPETGGEVDPVDDPVDTDDDEADGVDPEASAPSVAQAAPVPTDMTAPTPRATAKPPTRPT
jgi:hypothetical protein